MHSHDFFAWAILDLFVITYVYLSDKLDCFDNEGSAITLCPCSLSADGFYNSAIMPDPASILVPGIFSSSHLCFSLWSFWERDQVAAEWSSGRTRRGDPRHRDVTDHNIFHLLLVRDLMHSLTNR